MKEKNDSWVYPSLTLMAEPSPAVHIPYSPMSYDYYSELKFLLVETSNSPAIVLNASLVSPNELVLLTSLYEASSSTEF